MSMNLLLDTQVVLWWFLDSPRLTKPAIDILEKPGNTFFISAASLWEIWIKHAKHAFPFDADALENAIAMSGMTELVVNGAHARAAAELPRHHADPFDRMLVAQARVEELDLVTYDKALKPYGVPVLRRK